MTMKENPLMAIVGARARGGISLCMWNASSVNASSVVWSVVIFALKIDADIFSRLTLDKLRLLQR